MAFFHSAPIKHEPYALTDYGTLGHVFPEFTKIREPDRKVIIQLLSCTYFVHPRSHSFVVPERPFASACNSFPTRQPTSFFRKGSDISVIMPGSRQFEQFPTQSQSSANSYQHIHAINPHITSSITFLTLELQAIRMYFIANKRCGKYGV